MLYFVTFAFVYRLAMLGVSIRNEKALRRAGAVEYGAANSKVLAVCHVGFYVAAVLEGWRRSAPFDAISILGLCLYFFGATILFVVSRLLGRLWTVKLIIAPDHQLNAHFLFRWVRHPNYFLNILPELVGFALYLHAFITLSVGVAIYLIPLTARIRLENHVMQDAFPALER